MSYALTVGVCIKYLMELKRLRSSVQNAFQDIRKLHQTGAMTVLFKIVYVPYVAVAITAKNQGISNTLNSLIDHTY